MVQATPARSRGGRRARIASRTAEEPEADPCPPGQIGGQYQPLSEAEIDRIYRTALRLLGELGMGETPPVLIEAASRRGAFINGHGRLCFPQAMLEDIIAAAPKSFVFHGRDPKHSFEVGAD
ncbi:MAG: trimethylamine methyltransferase family protein, partial [Pseudomonadota bacterium]